MAEPAGVLELEVPETISVPLPPGEPHDIGIGLAVEAGGRFFLIAEDRWNDVIVEDGLERSARVRMGGKTQEPEVQFLE